MNMYVRISFQQYDRTDNVNFNYYVLIIEKGMNIYFNIRIYVKKS